MAFIFALTGAGNHVLFLLLNFIGIGIAGIGIIGIGGLGTMGIKLAKAMGNRVVAISTSPSKEAMAKEKGADAFIVSKDPESMKAEAAKLDLILNTVSAAHECSEYLPLLA